MPSRAPKKVKVVCQMYLDANISKTVRDRGSVQKDHQQGMAYRELNGHIIEIQDAGLAEVCTL